MRKQTKVVAVASAAALLAIGGAMTSFAAQGWVEEDGTWYYYDKDGNRVEDEWKKSGNNFDPILSISLWRVAPRLFRR